MIPLAALVGTAVPRIHQLPTHVANVIAAGEVVERPASVVKELVENALDAGATDIHVTLHDAGMTLIEVRDNGCGLHADDVALALQRHATSKVRSLDDLQQIASLGFRGEALPSIAAAAQRFALRTRTADAAEGTHLACNGGTPPTLEPAAMPRGTLVRVEQLFGALPARRKFLKSERTELAHCQDFCFRLALGAWQTRITLTHADRTVLRAESTGSPQQRVTELFGHAIADALVPLAPAAGDAAPIGISGWCSPPGLAAGPRGDIYLYVNGRTVRDRVLLHAVREGYRTYVPDGFTPLVLLSLTLPPDAVDVNVHPAKAEVRFANSHAVHQFVVAAIRKVLGQANTLRAAPSLSAQAASHHSAPSAVATVVRDSTPLQWNAPPRDMPTAPAIAAAVAACAPTATAQPAATQMPLTAHAPRYLGQLGTTYLLFDVWPRGLLLVDQHAAHERIGYEQLKRHAAAQQTQQALLVPLVIDCTPLQHAALLEQREIIRDCGIDYDDFGGQSLAVTAMPSLLNGHDIAGLLRTLADDFRHGVAGTAAAAIVDHVLMTIACHRQIRAGERLTTDEADALLAQLHLDTGLDRCPHGRPTWLVLSHNEITRRFGRS